MKNQTKRIYKIVNNWLETVKEGTPTEISKLYAKDGVLLGTVAENVKQGRGVIKTYFEMFKKKNPEGIINSIIFQYLGNEYGVADGNYTFELDDEENPGERVFVQARFTFVVNLKTEEIHTHHSSSRPVNNKITNF
jgi:uncharacterized protein (TIGR02246 family)